MLQRNIKVYGCIYIVFVVMVVCSVATWAETKTLTTTKRGYATSTGWEHLATDMAVGFVDNIAPLNNVNNRAFAWFDIPSDVQNGDISSAQVSVQVTDLEQWNSKLTDIVLYDLGSKTWPGFYNDDFGYGWDHGHWNALDGVSFHDWATKSSTLYFDIFNPSILNGKSQIGFVFRARPDDPSGSAGNNTHRIYLNNPRLIIQLATPTPTKTPTPTFTKTKTPTPTFTPTKTRTHTPTPTNTPPNDPPQLSNGYVNPQSGDANTSFYWYVDYYDPDGDTPSTKHISIGSDTSSHAMKLHSGTESNGTYRYGPRTLPVGTDSFYFFFSDGEGHSTRLPASGEYSGPTVSVDTPTYTPIPTWTQTNTPTRTRTATYTPSNTLTPSPTPTSESPTNTPTQTNTPVVTYTPTNTPSYSPAIFVLDDYGAVHTGGAANQCSLTGGPYFGWDIARAMDLIYGLPTTNSSKLGVAVLDGFGAVHTYSSSRPPQNFYFYPTYGDIATDIAVFQKDMNGLKGAIGIFVLDRTGKLWTAGEADWQVAQSGSINPPLNGNTQRAVDMTLADSTGLSGWIMDNMGKVYPFGGAFDPAFPVDQKDNWIDLELVEGQLVRMDTSGQLTWSGNPIASWAFPMIDGELMIDFEVERGKGLLGLDRFGAIYTTGNATRPEAGEGPPYFGFEAALELEID
jgi:hypothetical protein